MGDYAAKFLPGDHVSYLAAAPIVGGNVVYLSAAGQITPTTAASNAVVGVAVTDAATGDTIAVTRGGVQRLVSSAAINVGDSVVSAASGRIASLGAGTNYSQVLGTALTAAGAAGVTVDVQWEK